MEPDGVPRSYAGRSLTRVLVVGLAMALALGQYARIFNASPLGITETAGLSADIAHALQVVAAETT